MPESNRAIEARTGASEFWKTVHDNERLALHAALYTWPAGQIPPGRVLDLGSEYGFGSLLIAELNPSLHVLGMDLDTAGLRYSRKVSGTVNIPQVHGDARWLPVASESFSGIYMIHLLHLIDDPDRVLSEAWRALEPGGVAIVAIPQEGPENSGEQATREAGPLASFLKMHFSEVLYPDEIRGQLPSFPPQAFRLDGQASAWLAVCRKK